MVIGLLTIAGIPSTIGVCEALSAQKKQNAAAKEKAKFHATAELPSETGGEAPLECSIVLLGGRIFLNHPDSPPLIREAHKFAGYYFSYPADEPLLGLVSTIADDPPMLNWIYFDRDSGRMQHAGRKDTIGHRVGPWGWTEDDRWLTYDGLATGFVAVEDEATKTWEIFLDRDEQIAEGVPILIRRRLEFGMESRYVRDSEKNGQR